MKAPGYTLPTHLSIIWGITLAIMTLVEWNSLDRDPVRQEILSPFIHRQLEVTVMNEAPGANSSDLVFEPDTAADAKLNYEVELSFDGPLFLACFFVPILIFHGIGLLWRRLRVIR